MNPDQPEGQEPPAPNYDFILNPQTPAKPKVIVGVTKNPFIMRLVLLIVGVAVLMGAIAIAVTLFFGSKNNPDDLVSIAQTEQEIVRLSGQGDKAVDQAIKNAAITAELSIKSNQRASLAFLQRLGRTVKPTELLLKKDVAIDKQLTAARQTSTFDNVYAPIMRTQLAEYAALLKTAHSRTTGPQERALLSSHYTTAQLLLKQWPANP